MHKVKEYSVTDLFFGSYADLSVKNLAQLGSLRRSWLHLRNQLLRAEEPDESLSRQYGLVSISILRLLRRRPLLVDRITVPQALDCLKELTFLERGWYFFPKINGFESPDEYMHNRTFDHFVYADHELSKIGLKYNIERNDMARLAACIYNIPGQIHFNEDEVEKRAAMLLDQAKSGELELVMQTFANVREWLVLRCSTLFPPTSAGAVELKTTGPLWKEMKVRTAELRLTWKDPGNKETNYVGHARYLEVMDHLESIAKRKDAA